MPDPADKAIAIACLVAFGLVAVGIGARLVTRG